MLHIWVFWTISSHFISLFVLSQSIWFIFVYLCLSLCTSVNLILSWSILGCLGLSRATLGYLGLSWAQTIAVFPRLFQAILGYPKLSPDLPYQAISAISGYICLSLAISDYLWLFLSSIRVQVEAGETFSCFFLFIPNMSCRGTHAPRNQIWSIFYEEMAYKMARTPL